MKKNSFLRLFALFAITVFSFTLYSCKGNNDGEIQKNVNEKLASMPGVTADVKDGIATITGTCNDEMAKANATAEAKSVTGVRDVVNNCNVPMQEPVIINTDDALNMSVKDAVKDYEGVTATVMNGEITLTGTIKRDRLPKLLQAVNSLNPKKVNNQLVIKK